MDGRSGAWTFADAREPARFAAGRSADEPGVEHAVEGSGTLCGLSLDAITVYRHQFCIDAEDSCHRCSDLAEATPAEPGAQERLHEQLQRAPDGSLRDELITALLRGAAIPLWINGPSTSLGQHYGRLEEITEGADAVANALAQHQRIGLARVEDGPECRFLVVLPPGHPPVIARLHPAS